MHDDTIAAVRLLALALEAHPDYIDDDDDDGE